MQALKKIWVAIHKYSALLVGLLLAALAYVKFARPKTVPPALPSDADRDGQNDEQQIEDIQDQAQVARDSAQQHVDAAQEAVQRPTAVTPSKTVRDAVDRNNDIDY